MIQPSALHAVPDLRATLHYAEFWAVVITRVIRAQGGDEQAILRSIQTAKANHQQVVISQQKPGVGWKRLGGQQAVEPDHGMSPAGLLHDAFEARSMAEALLRQDSRGTGQSSAQVRELEVLARELVVEANDQLGVPWLMAGK